MYFTLKDKDFTVKSTLFLLRYDDEQITKRYMRGRGLYLHIGAYMNEITVPLDENDSYEWAPDIYHNNGIMINIRNWKELEGKTFEWESDFDEQYGEAGFLYVTEHNEVHKGKIEILERNRNTFKIKWTGEGDVFWDDEYNKNVPFDCEFTAEFNKIEIAQLMAEKTEEDLRKEISEFIDLTEFDFIVRKDETGNILKYFLLKDYK